MNVIKMVSEFNEVLFKCYQYILIKSICFNSSRDNVNKFVVITSKIAVINVIVT